MRHHGVPNFDGNLMLSNVRKYKKQKYIELMRPQRKKQKDRLRNKQNVIIFLGQIAIILAPTTNVSGQ